MDFTGTGTLILALCIMCLILLIMRSQNNKRKEMPPGPTPLPILGNLLQLNVRELPKSLNKLSKIYGDVFTVHLGPRPAVVLHGYDTVKEALVDRADVFSNRAKIFAAEIIFKDYGVFFSNGERWKQLRRFSITTLRNFGMGKRSIEERIQEESRCLRDELNKHAGSSFDPTYLLALAVSNVICSVVFGERFEYDDEKFLSLLAMLKESFKMSISIGQLLNCFPKVTRHIPGPHHKILKNLYSVKEFVKDKVKEHQETLDLNCPRDFIDCFLIKMEEETKVKKEIDLVIGQNRSPSVEDRTKMPYTDAVIHEIQRLANVAPLGGPHATNETTIFRGYTIPKGTNVFPLLTSVLTDPKYFPNPEKFDPGHFLNETGGFQKPEAFIPFSTGKRICLGEGMARMEIFLFLTYILQNFNLKSDEDPSNIDLSPLPNTNGAIHRPYKLQLVPH
ncbi:hypothetical protein GDO78_019562 [Eleutherodactylus coqui]|uniref:Uncharacterized protein n=1 Tax=Eleutherodactylus coqui TaxID=57060 RepID=A0A8J6EAQ4_ELECQ|nr:hypothetical protein GDO78_019562 [Eleutherodactylus coqui]